VKNISGPAVDVDPRIMLHELSLTTELLQNEGDFSCTISVIAIEFLRRW